MTRHWATLLGLFLAASTTLAQREYIEEVVPASSPLDDVDLDAPDPALTGKRPSGDPVTPSKVNPPTPQNGKPDLRSNPPADPRGREPSADPKVGAVGDAPALEEGSGFEVVATSREAFLEKVAPFFQANGRGEVAAARKQLPTLERAATEFGLHGLQGGFSAPAAALAAVRAAQTAVAEGRLDDANDLLEAAAHLAPDDLDTHLAAVGVRLSKDGPIAALTSLPQILSASFSDPVIRGAVVARLALVALCSLLLMLLVSTIALAIPAASMIAFDIRTFLPRGVHAWQALIVVALLGIAPTMLGIGVVPGMVWLIVLSAGYLERRRRFTAVAVAVVSCTLPLLAGVVAAGQAVAGSEAAALTKAVYDIDGARVIDGLRREEAAGRRLETTESAALAFAAHREGRLGEARERFTALARTDPSAGWAHGGLGVTLAILGEDELAIAEFGLAIQSFEGVAGGEVPQAAAAFNASLLHHKARRTEKAQALIAPVAEQHPELLAVFRRVTFRDVDEVTSHNRAFVPVYPPPGALALPPSTNAQAGIEDAFARLLWRGLDTTTALGLLAVLALLAAAMAGLSSRLRLARPCDRCGDPASRRVDGPDVPEGSCAACYHAFLSTKSRVDAGVRIRKENAIRRRGRRRALTVLVLSLAPGAGHLYAGAVGRGMLLLLVATVSASTALWMSGLVPGPWLPTGSPWMWMAPSLVLLVVALLLGFRSARDVADDERRGIS